MNKMALLAASAATLVLLGAGCAGSGATSDIDDGYDGESGAEVTASTTPQAATSTNAAGASTDLKALGADASASLDGVDAGSEPNY